MSTFDIFGVKNSFCIIPPRKNELLRKVKPFLKHICQISIKAWLLSKFILTDQWTIISQGRHPNKQLITYKPVSDGFQYNTVCNQGCIYMLFRNEPILEQYKESTKLYVQCLIMFNQLKYKYHRANVNNLHMSAYKILEIYFQPSVLSVHPFSSTETPMEHRAFFHHDAESTIATLCGYLTLQDLVHPQITKRTQNRKKRSPTLQ